MLITSIYLMNSNNPKYVETRKMMVQDAIDEIIKVQNFRDFYQTSFIQIAKFGLQLKTRKLVNFRKLKQEVFILKKAEHLVVSIFRENVKKT